MSIREYSMTRDSTRQLSPSFRVREFACKGSDVVLIDDELVVLLQCIREHFGKPVHITSGYRTAAHNAAVGGSKSSQHLLGRAADFYVEGVDVPLWPPTPRPCCPGGAASGATRRTQSTPPARPAGCTWTPAPTRAVGVCEGVIPMETVLAALITGAVTLIGVLIANSRSQAVTDTKLEELTREVRAHNNFAQRVPVLEEQMKVANHRIADLEANEHERERI